MAALDKWGKVFLKGTYVLGDKLSIADFKVGPHPHHPHILSYLNLTLSQP